MSYTSIGFWRVRGLLFSCRSLAVLIGVAVVDARRSARAAQLQHSLDVQQLRLHRAHIIAQRRVQPTLLLEHLHAQQAS